MEILKESVVQKEKFKKAANKLLNNCFIIKKKEDTKNDYMFIVQNKDLFIEYFDLLGYTIEINELHGVVALINIDGIGRLKLKKIESIFLLILRLLYVEKRKELSLNEEVMVLSEEIHDKYNMLNIKSKPTLDKKSFQEMIRLYKRYNIISNIDSEVTLWDARIKIYPSILFALPNENINSIIDSINDKLNKYASGGESQSDDEETM